MPQQANDHLHALLRVQRDSVSFLKTDSDRSVTVDTTFNLFTYLLITDTSYRNKHLVNTIDEGAPVHLGPIMLHFTRDEKTFELEILSANPNLKNISFIGVDLESAVFTGLKTMIPGLFRLICMHHLMKRDESKHADLLPKTG